MAEVGNLRRIANDYGKVTIAAEGKAYEVKMRTIAAGVFKAKCLAIMDEVQAKREPVIVTKHGIPVAKLVPIEQQTDPIFGFLTGQITIHGDIIAPAVEKGDWEILR